MDAPRIPPPISPEQRRAQLAALACALEEIVSLLNTVPGQRWAVHFDVCLERARVLRTDGFVQADLNALSGSVRCVYGGMGSFADYVPVEPAEEPGTWTASPVNEPLDELRSRVWRLALDLMVVGQY